LQHESKNTTLKIKFYSFKKNIMKKYIYSATLVAAIGLTILTCYQISKNCSYELSETAIENIEALADDEQTTGSCKWSRQVDKYGCVYHICLSNGEGIECTCGETAND
jgi:hypothetical protein